MEYVNGIKLDKVWRNDGRTETGKKIPANKPSLALSIQAMGLPLLNIITKLADKIPMELKVIIDRENTVKKEKIFIFEISILKRNNPNPI